MPRENKSKYAVLGLLAECPKSGYDVKNAIRTTLGNFWSESFAQVYPILNQLQKEGLATKSVQTSEGQRDKHIYTITDKGTDVLKAWLMKPADEHKARVEVLLKLFFGTQVSVEENVKHVERYRQEHQAFLSEFDAIEKLVEAKYAGYPGLPYWLMTVRCGLHVSRAYVEWCDETLATLHKMADR